MATTRTPVGLARIGDRGWADERRVTQVVRIGACTRISWAGF